MSEFAALLLKDQDIPAALGNRSTVNASWVVPVPRSRRARAEVMMQEIRASTFVVRDSMSWFEFQGPEME